MEEDYLCHEGCEYYKEGCSFERRIGQRGDIEKVNPGEKCLHPSVFYEGFNKVLAVVFGINERNSQFRS